MHVARRSPSPASPPKVTTWPPMAVPRRAISASPRVMTAARVLSPVPSPSAMPEAMAMTFLSAPATSQPTTSGLVYTRNRRVQKTCCRRRRDGLVAHGQHGGGGVTGEDLLGQVRAGQHAVGVTGHDLLDDLGHAQASALLESLGQADHRNPGTDVGRGGGQRVAEPVRRDAHHQQVGAGHRLGHGVVAVEVRVQPGAREVALVRRALAHLAGHRRDHAPTAPSACCARAGEQPWSPNCRRRALRTGSPCAEP